MNTVLLMLNGAIFVLPPLSVMPHCPVDGFSPLLSELAEFQPAEAIAENSEILWSRFPETGENVSTYGEG